VSPRSPGKSINIKNKQPARDVKATLERRRYDIKTPSFERQESAAKLKDLVFGNNFLDHHVCTYILHFCTFYENLTNTQMTEIPNSFRQVLMLLYLRVKGGVVEAKDYIIL